MFDSSHIDSNSLFKRLRESHSYDTWDFSYWKAVHSWGGHLARMGGYDPDRLAWKVFNYYDWNHLQGLPANVMASDSGPGVGKRLFINTLAKIGRRMPYTEKHGKAH